MIALQWPFQTLEMYIQDILSYLFGLSMLFLDFEFLAFGVLGLLFPPCSILDNADPVVPRCIAFRGTLKGLVPLCLMLTWQKNKDTWITVTEPLISKVPQFVLTSYWPRQSRMKLLYTIKITTSPYLYGVQKLHFCRYMHNNYSTPNGLQYTV